VPIITIIIIIIIIIRHQSDLNRPVSTSSNGLFKRLPSSLRPFGLQFSTFFLTILLLFILVTCRSHFDLYLLGFLSNGSAFNLPKYRVIRNDCPGFNNSPYTIHLR